MCAIWILSLFLKLYLQILFLKKSIHYKIFLYSFMHIMIYNKIVIFRNYITTCLWKKKKGTVITYCEASKKYPNKCYWQHNNIKNNCFKKRRKDYKDDTLGSSEFPVKTLGLWPPSALERWKGQKGLWKEGECGPLEDRSHLLGAFTAFPFQAGRTGRYIGDSPDLPLTEYRVATSLGEGRGGKRR